MKKELKNLEKKYIILKIIYEKEYKKIRDNSLIFSFMKITSNKRNYFLKKSNFTKESLGKDFESYLSENYIKETDEPGFFCLTFYGMWTIESSYGNMTTEIYFKILEKYYLDVFLGEKKISDKQKLQLFVLFAMKCFDKENCMNLKMSENVNNKWQEIVLKCYDFIVYNNVISNFKLKKEDVFGKQGADNKISNLFRHTDELHKSTKGVFNTVSKKQRYYLDIYGDVLKKDNLIFIFTRIFDKLDYSIIIDVIDFSSNLIRDYDFIVFSNINEYSNYSKIEEIKDCLVNF